MWKINEFYKQNISFKTNRDNFYKEMAKSTKQIEEKKQQIIKEKRQGILGKESINN